MKSRTAVFAVTLAFAGAAEASTRLDCPASLAVTEQVQVPVPWKAFRKSAEHRYRQMSLFDGPPSHEVQLKPDNGDDAKASSSVWTLGPTDSPYVACEYEGTNTVLTQPVGHTVKECRTEKRSKSEALVCD